MSKQKTHIYFTESVGFSGYVKSTLCNKSYLLKTSVIIEDIDCKQCLKKYEKNPKFDSNYPSFSQMRRRC